VNTQYTEVPDWKKSSQSSQLIIDFRWWWIWVTGIGIFRGYWSVIEQAIQNGLPGLDYRSHAPEQNSQSHTQMGTGSCVQKDEIKTGTQPETILPLSSARTDPQTIYFVLTLPSRMNCWDT
jgi:hypothetical protein